MLYALVRKLLFHMEPERAHDFVTQQLIPLQRFNAFTGFMRSVYGAPPLPRTLWGMRFDNPLGIAAGFDKNAMMIPFLGAVGFGFVEVGTVTLQPQPGNPRPRMFRDPDAGALINRLGFNNEGADAAARRLEELWSAPSSATMPPLFVNIGKNKDVPAEGAVESYRAVYRRLAPLADAVVVNVSSPNTPGLRDLQRVDSLRQIIDGLRDEREKISSAPRRATSRPILVKIAPDLADEEVEEIAILCRETVDGLTATNTTLRRDGWTRPDEQGGLSGRPLLRRSTEVLSRVRSVTGAEFPLVGVGGIFNADDVRAKFAAGADLVQAYTGFIYEGPSFASRIVRDLVKSAS